MDQFNAFRGKRASRDGLQAYCRPCSAVSFREYNLDRNYGLTVDKYAAMLESQGGTCAICGKAEIATNNASDAVRAMAIDHDHATGAVRGLLCTKCNTGLGAFGDDPTVLRRAIDYLRRHATLAGEQYAALDEFDLHA